MSTLPAAQDFTELALSQVDVQKNTSLGAMQHHVSEQKQRLLEQAQLLQEQLQEIERREQLAEKIYRANYNFTPVLLKPYSLYEHDNITTLSMIAPYEWTNTVPYGKFVGYVRQLGDGTWEPTEELTCGVI